MCMTIPPKASTHPLKTDTDAFASNCEASNSRASEAICSHLLHESQGSHSCTFGAWKILCQLLVVQTLCMLCGLVLSIHQWSSHIHDSTGPLVKHKRSSSPIQSGWGFHQHAQNHSNHVTSGPEHSGNHNNKAHAPTTCVHRSTRILKQYSQA